MNLAVNNLKTKDTALINEQVITANQGELEDGTLLM
jgi:hypothetical protein